MTDQEIFSEWAFSHGGLLDLAHEPNAAAFFEDRLSNLRELLSEAVNFCRNPDKSAPPPANIQNEVYLDFVNNPELMAYAVRSKDREFIAIFTGTFEIVYSTFFRLLSHPLVRQGIGRASLETPPALIPFVPINAEEWKKRKKTEGDLRPPTPKPVDPERHHYAMLVSTIVVDFILLHEFGHICAGHLGLQHEISQMGVQTICPQTGGYSLSRKTDQTLELNADSFAAGSCVTTAFDRHLNPQETLPPEWVPFYRNLRQAIETHFFAIYTFFRIFEMAHGSSHNLDAKSYPPARLRLGFVAANMKSHLKRLGHVDIANEFIPEISRKIIGEVDASIDLIVSEPTVKYRGDEEETERLLSHYADLIQHWNDNVYDKLIPHSRSQIIKL